ncbi:MAG: glutaredoxin [Pseudomonadales bacterium]|nr:glutaredoxin [Pseudomonadales bacterium]MCP5358958.1 glutaredoxin [Pseudomonadales bacterium]
MNETVSDTRHSPLNGRDFIDQRIADPQHPVVLFSLSWCSFCRAAKQLLAQIGVKHEVFELDQGVFLEPAVQQQVRTRLAEITGSGTLPQLFVGGENLGGYTDVAAAMRNGQLARVLQRHGISTSLPTPP